MKRHSHRRYLPFARVILRIISLRSLPSTKAEEISSCIVATGHECISLGNLLKRWSPMVRCFLMWRIKCSDSRSRCWVINIVVQSTIIRPNQKALYFYWAGPEISRKEKNYQNQSIKENTIFIDQSWNENWSRWAENFLAMWG